MKFILSIFSILSTCITYLITSLNDDSYNIFQSLIEYSDEKDLNVLYDEFRKNTNFTCMFIVNKNDENGKIITIEELNNNDNNVGNNILPTIFCEITNLKNLDLTNLNLSTLPNRFENLKELEELNLNRNDFREFPRVLFLLSKLKVISLDSNEFTTIPHEIIQMESIEILSIVNCGNLKNISVNLFRLKNLKEIDLSHNTLLFSQAIFINYLTCTNDCSNANAKDHKEKNNADRHSEFYNYLKVLRMCSNNLSLFPSFFQNLNSLETLNISWNLFTEIPKEIHSFSYLKTLDISFNYIQELIIENGIFNNLKQLDLQFNNIDRILICDNSLQNVESFNLYSNMISKLDKNIFQLKRLKQFIIFNNDLTEIEKYSCTRNDIMPLTLNLKDISILANIFCYNCIVKLDVICKEQFNGDIEIFDDCPINSKIKYLDLSGCFLTRIPSGISKLNKLEVFMANNNQIVDAENVFGTNSCLKILDLSYNRIININGNIFAINTLTELLLHFNYIELLPVNINHIRNRNLIINLIHNPLHAQMNVDSENSELISIEQVDHDIRENIRRDDRIISIFVISSRITIPQEDNIDFDVKSFYESRDIPINEKLDLDKIKLCMPFIPEKHIKTKKQIEEILQNIFQKIEPYKKEEKLAFLLRRLDVYYLPEADLLRTSVSPSIDFQKRNLILDYFESIVIIMTEMLPEKKEFVNDTLVILLHALNFNSTTTDDKVTCLDGQSEAYVETYMRLKLGNDCSNAEYKIMKIISNLKIDILKQITTGRDEAEELETFLNWRNLLSAELGFHKEINIYGNMSIIQELHDKKYIIEEFFNKFNSGAIINEINKCLRNNDFGVTLYNSLREYFISIYGIDTSMNNIFEYIHDDNDGENFFQLNNDNGFKLLKSMRFLYTESVSEVNPID